jgi:predicted transcriptional regulator of viral defense system
MKPSEALLEIQDLASSQWGLVTSSQAQELGVTKSQLARFATQGYLERLRHGVYAVSGVPFNPRRDIQAAWMAIRPEIQAYRRVQEPTVEVVSHASAADLLGIGDVDADLMEFTSPARRQSRSREVRIHLGHVSKRDKTQVDGIPTTTAAKTVQDLAAAGMDGGHLASIVRDAIAKSGVPIQELAKRLDPYAAKYGESRGDGLALVERFLEEAGVPESSLELAYPGFKSALEQMAGYFSRQVWEPEAFRQLQRITERMEPQSINIQALGSTMQELSKRMSEAVPTNFPAADVKRMSELLAKSIRPPSLEISDGVQRQLADVGATDFNTSRRGTQDAIPIVDDDDSENRDRSSNGNESGDRGGKGDETDLGAG